MKQIPFYAKYSIIFVGLYVFFTILFLAKSIIIPVIFSILISIILNPVVNYLESKKIKRVLGISLILILFFIISLVGLLFFYSQLIQFIESYPILVEKVNLLIDQTIDWVVLNSDLKISNINSWLDNKSTDFMNETNKNMGQTILNTGSFFVLIFIIPVYIFLILIYKTFILEFIHKLFISSDFIEVDLVLANIKKIIQSYLVGLMLEALLVFILYSISLISFGVDYAILLAILGAFLNLIPYIGSIIAVILPILIAITTSSPLIAFGVLISYIVIQFIDNNLIVPNIVASKVQLNPLISILVVIIGEAIWGLPGMFLAIPMTAILKVIFDHIEGLKPWGFLLGKVIQKKSAIQSKII